PDLAYGLGEGLGIIRIVLGEIDAVVERHEESLVHLSLQYGIEKLYRGFLLEADFVANAGAGVDEQRHRKRKICILAEVADGLCFVIFEYFETVLLEPGDESSLGVEHREHDVDAIDINGNRLL